MKLRAIDLTLGIMLILTLAACQAGHRSAALWPPAGATLEQLPPPRALQSRAAPHAVASTAGELVLTAAEFDSGLPFQRAVADAAQVVLNPAWTAASPSFSGTAYLCFAFDLTSYGGASTLWLDWAVPPATVDQVWVGLSDFPTNAWVWQPGVLDQPLSVPALLDYADPATHLLLVCVLLLGTDQATLDGLALGGTDAPGSAGALDIELPSAATGGGNLAVRVIVPEPGVTYFAAGAPVLITVPGGNSQGTLAPVAPTGLEGMIHLSFLFPGGTQGGFASDGAYDNRGQACIDALRDVLLFAGGLKPDAAGFLLPDLCAAPVLTDNVGIYASSNGGPITYVTLSQYGDLTPGLKYVVGWENPSNGQTVNTDLGPGSNFDGSGPPAGPTPRWLNPYYSAYGPVSMTVDYSTIAYDSVVEKIFLDGNGNGTFDTVALPDGYLVPDVNGNHVLDPGEDFGLGYLYEDLPSHKCHYSVEAVQALWDHVIFPHAAWPLWLDTPAAASDYWLLRDAARCFDVLAGVRPDLKLLINCTAQDHVQNTPDRAHTHQIFEGFDRNAMWVKLNPSRAMVLTLDPSLVSRGDLPDLAPNAAPASWTALDYTFPEDLPAALLQAASVREMAELVQ